MRSYCHYSQRGPMHENLMKMARTMTVPSLGILSASEAKKLPAEKLRKMLGYGVLEVIGELACQTHVVPFVRDPMDLLANNAAFWAVDEPGRAFHIGECRGVQKPPLVTYCSNRRAPVRRPPIEDQKNLANAPPAPLSDRQAKETSDESSEDSKGEADKSWQEDVEQLSQGDLSMSDSSKRSRKKRSTAAQPARKSKKHRPEVPAAWNCKRDDARVGRFAAVEVVYTVNP